MNRSSYPLDSFMVSLSGSLAEKVLLLNGDEWRSLTTTLLLRGSGLAQ